MRKRISHGHTNGVSDGIADELNSFLRHSAHRAPGKRQIRAPVRPVPVEVSQIVASSDDDDDEDYNSDGNEEDNQNGSDDDSDDSGDAKHNGESSDDDDDSITSSEDESTKSGASSDEEDAEESTIKQRLESDNEDEQQSKTVSHNGEETIASENSALVSSVPSQLKLICALCLNLRHKDTEVMACDKCGLTVHENCYGYTSSGPPPEAGSESPSSSSSSEPWFCEACLAGQNPQTLPCLFCPNLGGAYKETDTGLWAHLLCALYNTAAGIAFGDIYGLRNITAFDMASFKPFGAKPCALCTEPAYKWTGLCIHCDAGMCKVYFHVTCAHARGLLCETPIDAEEEHQSADPFFAHCEAHSDRETRKLRVRQYQKYLQQQAHWRRKPSLAAREQAKLEKQKRAYAAERKPPAVLPLNLQWSSRLLHTDADFLRKMQNKLDLCNDPGILDQAKEGLSQEFFSEEIVGKMTMPAAFSADFCHYYTGREKKIKSLKADRQRLGAKLDTLKKDESLLQGRWRDVNADLARVSQLLQKEHALLCSHFRVLRSLGCKRLPPIAPLKAVQKSEMPDAPRNAVVNTHSAAAVLTLHKCGKCNKAHDQHLLAHCDTCKKHYHLACLDPPLTKMPSKRANWGWECSFCGQVSTSDSESEMPNVNEPRKLRVTAKPVQRFIVEASGSPRKRKRLRRSDRSSAKRIKLEPAIEVKVEPEVSGQSEDSVEFSTT